MFGRFSIFILLLICEVKAVDDSEAEKTNRNILVLGSGGLVGRSVVTWLREHQYNVLEVRNRRHIDLRIPGSLDVFNNSNISYCIFLACEVGGAKFIESSEQSIQTEIINSNIKIYQTVLPWLVDHQIPFLFTSSYLQGTENSYGAIKRLGEIWIKQLGGLGKILRLWNVYGPEQVGLKSHVLSDWAHQCAAGGRAASLTDGREERQLVHVNDTAAACGAAMRHHGALDPVSDVSSGRWVTLRELAAALEAAALGGCSVAFADRPAAARARLSAQLTGALHEWWRAEVGLEAGCASLLEQYRTCRPAP